MSGLAHQVFISYHRSDVAVAEQVRNCLISNHIPTWMDQYDIPAGAYWPDEIDKGLGQSKFVVGLLSPDAVASRNVKNEWDWALQNGKQLVLLMTRPCVIPHRYVSINYIEATSDDLGGPLGALLRTPGLLAERSREAPRTRYALSGGLTVAWQESGEGEFDIVYVPGFISHLEHQWRNPKTAEYLRRWGTLGRLIRFDKRGTGLSDRALGVPTLEERMDDIRAVMDAAGTERAVIYGLSEGVPLSIQFAATYPHRTIALILYGGSATYVRDADYPWQKTLEAWQDQIAEQERTLPERWGTIDLARKSLEHYTPSAVHDEAFVEWFAEYMRLSASPGAANALDRMNLEVDVRSILSAIRVPTLVAHRVDEHDADIGEGRYIAAHIPGAVMRELPGNDHWPVWGDADSFFGAIESFLASIKDDPQTAVPDTVLATVTVIEVAAADATDFSGQISREIERFRGRLISLDSRRLIATFDGAARAIRFASTISDLLSRAGGEVASGLQTGEIEQRDQFVIGAAVEIARVLATAAGPDEVLATGTVRDLVAGSGIRFTEARADQAGEPLAAHVVLMVDRASVT